VSADPDSFEDAEVCWKTPISSRLVSSGVIMESGPPEFGDMGWSGGSAIILALLRDALLASIGVGWRPGTLAASGSLAVA
jgi:hypothetical protein